MAKFLCQLRRRDAPIAGDILYLAGPVSMFSEEVSVCLSILGKDPPHQCGGIIQATEGLNGIKRQRRSDFDLRA